MNGIKWLAALALAAAFGAAQAANPQVELKTNQGRIVLELYPEQAPKTVENFLHYVKDGFYQGTIFHRVIRGFMIQGGGYTRDFQQKATLAPVKNEAANGLKNRRGAIAMARTANPNSATAQFFINHADNPNLDHTPLNYGYCVFGKVIEGMEVVDKIAAIATGAGGPFPADVPRQTLLIEDARIISQ